MCRKHLLDAAPTQKEKQLHLLAKSDVSDVKNVKKPVLTVLSLLQISVHILIMKNVQIAAHVKKPAQEVSFFNLHIYVCNLRPDNIRSEAFLFSNRCLLFAICYVMIGKAQMQEL